MSDGTGDNELGVTIFGTIIAAPFCAFAPYGLALVFGLEEYHAQLVAWWWALDHWLRWPLFGLYGLAGFFMLVIIAVSGIAIVDWLWRHVMRGAGWLAESVETAVSEGLAGLDAVTSLLLWVLFWPVRLLGDLLRVVVAEPLACVFQMMQEQRELRRMYRSMFREQFKTYREFKRYWDERHDGADSEDERNTREDESARDDGRRTEDESDPLDEAIKLLGLPERFTKADLERRYKELMKRVHPDVVGPNDLARQLNEARALIKKRKGWK